MSNRITQIARQAAVDGTPRARVSQLARTVATQSDAKARIGQIARTVATQSDAKARIGQIARTVAAKPSLYSIGSLLSTSNKTSSSSISGTTLINIDSPQFSVIIVASDNESTINENSNLHISLTVGGVNATKIREYTLGGGSTDAGCTVSAWYITPTSLISSGSTVLASFATNKTAKAICGHVFGKDSALSIGVDGFSDLASTTEPTSMSATGTSNVDKVWIRAIGIESDPTTIGNLSPTNGWSEISGAGTSGSVSNTNICVRAEFAFKTGASSGTSDPNFTNAVSADNANILFGLSLSSNVYNDTMTGGVSLSGQSSDSAITSQVMSGGTTINGNSFVTSSTDIVGTNGIFCNGQATITAEFSPLISGNIICNGEFLVSLIQSQISTGGITANGLGLNFLNYQELTSGGLIINGTHMSTQNYENAMNGSILIGGEVNILDKYDEEGNGTITVGGESVASLIQETIISGSAILNGSAEVSKFQEEISVGGIVLTGTSLISSLFQIEMEKGIQVTGASDFQPIYQIASIGGIKILGEIEISNIYLFLSLGGCKINGRSPQGIKNTSIKISKISVKPKYEIGERVYVKCAKLCCYVLQAIRKIDRNENTFIYACGLGSFTENVVLSIAEFEKLEASVLKEKLCAKRTEET